MTSRATTETRITIQNAITPPRCLYLRRYAGPRAPSGPSIEELQHLPAHLVGPLEVQEVAGSRDDVGAAPGGKEVAHTPGQPHVERPVLGTVEVERRYDGQPPLRAGPAPVAPRRRERPRQRPVVAQDRRATGPVRDRGE